MAATVTAGSSSISLQEAVQWAAGDVILLVTTTWKGTSVHTAPARGWGRLKALGCEARVRGEGVLHQCCIQYMYLLPCTHTHITIRCWCLADEMLNQNEVLTVASMSSDGLTVSTQQPVQFKHYGEEYKAEVGVLTRTILFTSDEVSHSTGIGKEGRGGKGKALPYLSRGGQGVTLVQVSELQVETKSFPAHSVMSCMRTMMPLIYLAAGTESHLASHLASHSYTACPRRPSYHFVWTQCACVGGCL